MVVQSASDMIVKSFHNPTLSPIPTHIVKAIQNDKYTDFRDLLPEALSEAFDKAQQEGKNETAKSKKEHPVNTPIDWGLSFPTFAAVSTHSSWSGHPNSLLTVILYSDAR